MFLVCAGVDGKVVTAAVLVGGTVVNTLTTATFVATGLTLTDLTGSLVSAICGIFKSFLIFTKPTKNPPQRVSVRTL
jgi:hypothetical protein